MKTMLETALPSPTHRFLKLLADSGRLKRIYTQNIDDLEAKVGLKRVSTLSHDQLKHKVVQLHGEFDM
jgi:NAD-dependent histone deacetylase SIR2